MKTICALVGAFVVLAWLSPVALPAAVEDSHRVVTTVVSIGPASISPSRGDGGPAVADVFSGLGETTILLGEQATSEAILMEVNRRGEQLDSAGYHVIYFEGAYWIDDVDGEPYLITADAAEPYLALRLEDLLRALAVSSARSLVVLDLVKHQATLRAPRAPTMTMQSAVKSSRSKTRSFSAGALPGLEATFLDKVRAYTKGENVVFLISARDQSVSDPRAATAFSRAITSAIAPRGSNPANADINSDQQLSVVELASFVQRQVSATSEYGSTQVIFESGFDDTPNDWILVRDYTPQQSDFLSLLDPELDYILNSELGRDKYRQLYRILEGNVSASKFEQQVAYETRSKVLELALSRNAQKAEANDLFLTQDQKILVEDIDRLLDLVTETRKR